VTELEFLENLTQERWTALKFLATAPSPSRSEPRLCQAVCRSFDGPFTLACDRMECPGALRSLGLGQHDEQMARQMSEKTGMPPERARRLLAATPRLRQPARAVQMGRMERPDVLIAYLRPEAAMRLLRRWQLMTGDRLFSDLSAFTALCASLVTAHQEGRLVFSFGCPDSREYGGIGPDRLIAALPRGLAAQLMREGSEHANL